jgi:hypothetical protein
MIEHYLIFNLNYPGILYMFNEVTPNELKRVMKIEGISAYWLIDGGYGFNLSNNSNKDQIVRDLRRLLWKK